MIKKITHGEFKKWAPMVEKLAGQRVLVMGDVGVDRYTLGIVERISPEAPVPIVCVQEERHKLGLAANVADNIVALGGMPRLVGVVGGDRIAEDLKALMAEARIPIENLVTEPKRRTVLKERIVSEHQQLLRVDYESPHSILPQTEAALLQQWSQCLPEAGAVVIEDYAKGMLSEELIQKMIALAKKAGKTVLADPNSKTPLRFYRGVTVLTPNKKEAEELTGQKILTDHDLLAVGKKLLEQAQCQFVALTLGKEGMAIFRAGESSVHLIPTYAREVFDVSGAGDTVIAVLAMALSAGIEIDDAAVISNLAAGVEVSKRGTATVTRAEILEAIEFFSKKMQK